MLEALLLQRIAYGIKPNELARLKEIGFEAYIDEQLSPVDAEDAELLKVLKSYKVEAEFKKNGRQVKETWGLDYLNADNKKLWTLYQNRKELSHQEKNRPSGEVVIATWLRALYSKWQLREIIVDFWNNHFNISIDAHDAMPILLPIHDREVIRKHALGNFKDFLIAVAKSPCMLYYLDNALSKASPANENYARELFELHTLGAKHYFNHLYNRWREVPGALEGKPEGYIDEDVYEAARAFTGWTVADGRHDEKGGHLPDTGEFYYFEGWHDNYQKRVLGVEFNSNQAPMEDGLKVLELVAYHPATAYHICYKLCRRLVEDEPNEGLVKQAAALWLAQKEAPDQIKQVIRFILTHKAFKASLGTKVKRPPELIFSYLRSLGGNFMPNQHLFWMFAISGYRYFAWPTPTGHPDTAEYWLNSSMLLMRWNMMQTLLEDWHKMMDIDLIALQPKAVRTCNEIVDFWIERLLGQAAKGETRLRLVNFLAAGGVEDDIPYGEEREVKYRIYQMVTLLAMTPDFQYR